MDLTVELEHAGFGNDEEILKNTFKTIGQKKRINNLTFFEFFHNLMLRHNRNPESPMFQKLTPNIEAFKEKHYNANREWRYNFDAGEIRPYQDLLDRRENSKQDEMSVLKGSVDQTLVARAVEAEKKMKRLRMAKYSKELFDEIVLEMMKSKRTIMEMMAELDVDDEKIYES